MANSRAASFTSDGADYFQDLLQNAGPGSTVDNDADDEAGSSLGRSSFGQSAPARFTFSPGRTNSKTKKDAGPDERQNTKPASSLLSITVPVQAPMRAATPSAPLVFSSSVINSSVAASSAMENPGMGSSKMKIPAARFPYSHAGTDHDGRLPLGGALSTAHWTAGSRAESQDDNRPDYAAFPSAATSSETTSSRVIQSGVNAEVDIEDRSTSSAPSASVSPLPVMASINETLSSFTAERTNENILPSPGIIDSGNTIPVIANGPVTEKNASVVESLTKQTALPAAGNENLATPQSSAQQVVQSDAASANFSKNIAALPSHTSSPAQFTSLSDTKTSASLTSTPDVIANAPAIAQMIHFIHQQNIGTKNTIHAGNGQPAINSASSTVYGTGSALQSDQNNNHSSNDRSNKDHSNNDRTNNDSSINHHSANASGGMTNSHPGASDKSSAQITTNRNEDVTTKDLATTELTGKNLAFQNAAATSSSSSSGASTSANSLQISNPSSVPPSTANQSSAGSATSSAANPNNVFSSGLHESSPVPTSSTSIQAAHITNLGEQAEMKIGMRMPAFGALEVHASIHENQVGVVIGSEHGDLKTFLSAEIPALRDGLSQQELHFSSMSFEERRNNSGGFSTSNDSYNNDSRNDSRSNDSRENQQQSYPQASWLGFSSSAVTSIENDLFATGQNNLSIHA
jgi:hypothetical protein